MKYVYRFQPPSGVFIRLAFIIFVASGSLESSAQSLFNFGKNKDIYFLSQDERKKLGIDVIYELYQGHSTDSVMRLWNVTKTSISDDGMMVGWHQVEEPRTTKFNVDSLIAETAGDYDQRSYINGHAIYLEQGKMTHYGGEGYGSFDANEVIFRNDTVAFVMTTCVGHCGGNGELAIRKNVCDKNGKFTYAIQYPSLSGMDTTLQFEWDENGTVALSYIESFLQELMALHPGDDPDTTLIHYDLVGRLSCHDTTTVANDPTLACVKKIFGVLEPQYAEEATAVLYYVGNKPMEKYIKSKLRMIPSFLIIEVYKYAALAYIYDPVKKQYWHAGSVMLE